jgi:hypothetical protein
MFALSCHPRLVCKRPVLARLVESGFSFHFGFSAAVRISRGSKAFPEQSQTRVVVDSHRGVAAAFRKPNIAVSIDLTKRHSRPGSSILLARKLHASLWNIRRNCTARSAVRSRENGLKRRQRRRFSVSTTDSTVPFDGVGRRVMQINHVTEIGRHRSVQYIAENGYGLGGNPSNGGWRRSPNLGDRHQLAVCRTRWTTLVPTPRGAANLVHGPGRDHIQLPASGVLQQAIESRTLRPALAPLTPASSWKPTTCQPERAATDSSSRRWFSVV